MTAERSVSKRVVDVELAHLEAEATRSDASPSNLDLVERSRLYLIDVVRDEVIAEFGKDELGQGPSLLLTIMFCRGVFDADALYLALSTQPWSRAAWAGKRKNIRPVYARLAKKLKDSLFCLAHDGLYGFWLRADAEQRAVMIERRDARIAAAKRSRRPDPTGPLPKRRRRKT